VTVGLTIAAGPAMRFMDAAAGDLHTPDAYIRAVMEAVQASPGIRGGAQ